MVTNTGLIYGMGSNQYGKLGLSSEKILSVNTPKLIESLTLHRVVQVSCGLNHALALTHGHGIVYSWGKGDQGQLGRSVEPA